MTIEMTIPGSTEVAIAYEIQGSRLLDVWREERARLDETSRWPVAIADWVGDLGPGYIAHERSGTGSNPRNRTPDQIVEASRDLEPAALLADLEKFHAKRATPYFEGVLETELSRTRRAYGSSPSREDLLSALPAQPSRRDLDRYLLKWEEERERIEPVPDHQFGWYVPHQEHETPYLVLTPQKTGAETIALFSFFGEDYYDNVEASGLIAILRAWSQRWSAELVANWGTMLQFLVERPPAKLDEAWDLAWEQATVAPDTLHFPEVSVRDHARALIGRGDWFLHERP